MTQQALQHCDFCWASSEEASQFHPESGLCHNCYMRAYRNNGDPTPRPKGFPADPAKDRNSRRTKADARVKERAAEQSARIAAIKLAAGCTDCGYAEHPAALDFDHIYGEKLGNLGTMRSAGWEKIQAEIDKCEVVCANCHRIRTFNRLISG